MQYYWILILAVAAAAVLAIYYIYRKQHPPIPPADEMEGHDFEYYCADLLRGAGFSHVSVTRGSGDYGIDVLAERDGITYAIQCKCYAGLVGVSAVAQAYAGRDFYDRMVGAVMTNQYFTRPAAQMADKLHILLWDRDFLASIGAEL